ncbi:MAG: TonB-dependent receptor [Bacteroidales bacterium]|nr:TonB-dependent receptor [Bacteroidales bacterium]
MNRISLLTSLLALCLSTPLLPAEIEANTTAIKSDTLHQPEKKIKTVNMKEVVVSDDQQSRISSSFPGKDLITAKEIQSIPTLLGEADVMRAVRLLPGVQSVSEGNSGVYVRGGSAGQNLFILDDMELLNPSHLMGIYSAFNPLTTREVDVYKGNAPVNIQGRLSSTIEVHSIIPGIENQGFEINLGNISSSISMIQQSKDGKFDIILGYRRSYLDALGWGASLFIPDSKNYFKQNKYIFYDFNGKVNARLSDKTKLSISWYSGKDQFSYDNTDLEYRAKTDWGNKSAVLQLRHVPNTSNTIKSSVAYNSTFSGFDGELIANTLVFSSFFEQMQQKNQWEHRWGNHLLHTGLEFFGQQSTPVDMAMSYLSDTTLRHHSFYNAGVSAYVGDYYFAPSRKYQIYAGVRTTVDAPIGPYTYGETSYAKNKIIKAWYTFSPVVSLSLFPKEGHSMKVSCSFNEQNLHLASLSSIPLPNDLWAPSSPRLHPETSDQLTVGYYKTTDFFDFSVEAYGKYMKHLLIFNVITDNSTNQGFEDQFFRGKGLAYGVDFSLRKKTGIFTGSLKYSLSRSKRSFPMIMDGEWFNDKNDRPHDLSLTIGYTPNKKWDFSALWVFASGNNMTLPSGRWWMMGQIMNDYDNFNGFRFPPYHRLDLSANWHLKTKHLKESVLNFSIINAYNHANPYYAYFKVFMGNNQYNLDVKSYQISLFPIMPSVSWKFKF